MGIHKYTLFRTAFRVGKSMSFSVRTAPGGSKRNGDRNRWMWSGRSLLGGTALPALAIGALMLGGCTVVPVPLTDVERGAQAASDLDMMFGDQEPLRHALTLQEAFARALAYNLDHRVKLMEEAVARNDLDISRYEMLPRVVANAGYLWRNNEEASSSRSVLTGQQSLETSTSTDRNRYIADLTLSWNILDFGVSYYNARQAADRTLIAEEQRRRVVQNLLQEVRRAFWRAASAQRLGGEVRKAIRDAEAAMGSARKVESEGLRSPVDALRYQKALLDLLRQLEGAERTLATSKAELASLINLPPGRNFVVAVPGALRLDRTRMPVRQMEDMALLRNPDLREASYQTRISADESRKVLLKLLPGININYGPNYDSNSFLLNNNWYALALRASGNIVNLLQLPAQMQRADNAEVLATSRRQALSIAVLAKVHIAYQQYLSAVKEYHWSDQLASVDRRLYQQIVNRVSSDAQGDLERVSAHVSAVTSDLRRYQSYAEAQAALGRLYAVLGIDPVAEERIVTLDLDGLRRAIRFSEEERDSGKIALRPERPAAVPAASDSADTATASLYEGPQAAQPGGSATPSLFGLSLFGGSAAPAPTEPAQAVTPLPAPPDTNAARAAPAAVPARQAAVTGGAPLQLVDPRPTATPVRLAAAPDAEPGLAGAGEASVTPRSEAAPN